MSVTREGGGAPWTEPPIPIGGRFAGYRIEGVAGWGGMGIVYRARDDQLRRAVALKVIAPALARDNAFRERFKRESRLAAQIEHPNVVSVYSAGEEEGRLYIAMRFVDGVDLATLLRERRSLAPADAARIVAQVAEGLDAAHAKGLVHRDVKPGNVLLAGLRGEEQAYLTDFGLSVEGGAQGTLTRTGQWVGTVAYIAPEQLRGAAVDARTDVYALTGVMHHCLTGEVPFPAEHELDALTAHLSQPPPRPSARAPRVPPAFDRVVARGMSKDPARRYPSAGDLGRAALAASRGERPPSGERSVAVGSAAPAGHAAPTPRLDARRRVLLGIALAAAVAAAAVLVVALRGGNDKGRTPRPPHATRAIPVELSPDHLAVLDDRVWSLTTDVGRLQRVDPRTRHVDQFPPAVDLAGGEYAGVAAAAGSLWVAHDTAAGGIDRVDRATGEGVGHIGLPNVSAVAASRDAVWATFGGTRRATRNLVRIDPRAAKAIGPPMDAGRDPVAIAVDRESVWVVNRSPGTVTRVDVRSGRKRAVIQVGERPTAVAVGPAVVWVLNSGDQTLTRIDPATNQPVDAPTSLGKQLQDIALAGGVLWVAAADRTLTRLDPSSGATRGSPVATGSPPLTLAAAGKGVWVASVGDRTVTFVPAAAR